MNILRKIKRAIYEQNYHISGHANEEAKKIKCEFCDGEVKYRSITARFNYLGDVIYVKDTPARVCVKCGEEYFDASVYKHLEEIAKNRTRIKRKISFPLAEYEKIFA